MVNDHENDGLTQLVEVMRFRAPGHLFNVRRAGAVKPQPVAPDRKTTELEPFALRLNQDLSKFLPAHPAHHLQRTYALNAILFRGLASRDPTEDRLRIAACVADINSKGPHFRQALEAADVAVLHRHLLDYSQIKQHDPHTFPHIEVLGHRQDEVDLLFDTSIIRRKTAADLPRHATLVAINAELDRLVPQGAYFNELRQKFIDTVAYDPAIAKWVENDTRNAKDKKAVDGKTFVPNGAHSDVQKPIADLMRAVHAVREVVSNEAPPVRPMTPEDAVRIGRRIDAYGDASRAYESRAAGKPVTPASSFLPLVLPGTKIPGAGLPQTAEPLQVSKHLKAAVAQPPRQIFNPEPDPSVQNVIAVMDDLMPPSRQNFNWRMKLMKAVSHHRGRWLEDGNDSVPDFSGTMAALRNSHNKAFKQEHKIARLAEALDAYHLARMYPRQRAPAPRKPAPLWIREEEKAAQAPGTAVPKKTVKPHVPKNFSDMERAAARPGQQRLTFTPLPRKRTLEPDSNTAPDNGSNKRQQTQTNPAGLAPYDARPDARKRGPMVR